MLRGINLTTSASSDKKTQNSNFKADNENSADNGQKQKDAGEVAAASTTAHDDFPSKITQDNAHIPWNVLLNYKWRSELEYEVKILFEPEEKFSFETKTISSARKVFLRLYERSLQILNSKRDAILYEEMFGEFTRLNMEKNPANQDVMKIPNSDFDSFDN